MLYDELRSSNNKDYDFLKEAIIYTLQKHNVELTKNNYIIWLNEILKENFNCISSDFEHRFNVAGKTRMQLISHMLKYTSIPYTDINQIISAYADYINNSLQKKETKDNVSYDDLCEKIDLLNLNDTQKEYLKIELQNGNINMLRGLISDDLLNSYINSISNTGYGSK